MTMQPPAAPRSRLGVRALPMLAAIAVAGLVSAAAIAPSATVSYAEPSALDAPETQALEGLASIQSAAQNARERFTSEAAPPPPPPRVRVAPAAGIPNPGSARALGREMMLKRGWGAGQWNCLSALWDRESRWDVYAFNASSGAYGIPQALPGNKMAAAGADWKTNPATQITWGLSYIQGRYGSPCGAWDHSQRKGWY